MVPPLNFQTVLGFVYSCSILSFYFQWPGLYGPNGILPLSSESCPSSSFSSSSSFISIYFEKFLEFPSIVCFHESFGLTFEATTELLLFLLVLTAIVSTFVFMLGKSLRSSIFANILFAIYIFCLQQSSVS